MLRSVLALSIALASTALVVGCSGDDKGSTDDSNISAGPASADPNGPLCRPQEKIVFTCRTTTNKIVSVCASADLGANAGYLQYRFGSDHHTEIKLPEDASVQNFRDITTFTESNPATSGSYSYSDVTFTSADGAYAYSVNASVGHGQESAGVYVTHNGQQVADIQCKDWSEPEMALVKSGGVRPSPDNESGETR